MATLTLGTFAHWKLSREEEYNGCILSDPQKRFIQNELAIAAEQKLALIPTPESYQSFIQQEAFLSGQIALMRVMLERSDQSEIALKTLVNS